MNEHFEKINDVDVESCQIRVTPTNLPQEMIISYLSNQTSHLPQNNIPTTLHHMKRVLNIFSKFPYPALDEVTTISKEGQQLKT